MNNIYILVVILLAVYYVLNNKDLQNTFKSIDISKLIKDNLIYIIIALGIIYFVFFQDMIENFRNKDFLEYLLKINNNDTYIYREVVNTRDFLAGRIPANVINKNGEFLNGTMFEIFEANKENSENPEHINKVIAPEVANKYISYFNVSNVIPTLFNIDNLSQSQLATVSNNFNNLIETFNPKLITQLKDNRIHFFPLARNGKYDYLLAVFINKTDGNKVIDVCKLNDKGFILRTHPTYTKLKNKIAVDYNVDISRVINSSDLNNIIGGVYEIVIIK